MFSGAAVLSFFAGLLVDFLKGIFSDWRRDQDLKKAGADEAAIETQKHIQEKADAQSENDMRDRGDSSDVARRVRERIKNGGNPG